MAEPAPPPPPGCCRPRVSCPHATARPAALGWHSAVPGTSAAMAPVLPQTGAATAFVHVG